MFNHLNLPSSICTSCIVLYLPNFQKFGIYFLVVWYSCFSYVVNFPDQCFSLLACLCTKRSVICIPFIDTNFSPILIPISSVSASRITDSVDTLKRCSERTQACFSRRLIYTYNHDILFGRYFDRNGPEAYHFHSRPAIEQQGEEMVYAVRAMFITGFFTQCEPPQKICAST